MTESIENQNQKTNSAEVVSLFGDADLASLLISKTTRLLEEAVQITEHLGVALDDDNDRFDEVSVELLQFNSMLTKLGSWLLHCSYCTLKERLPSLASFGIEPHPVFFAKHYNSQLVAMGKRLEHLINSARRFEQATAAGRVQQIASSATDKNKPQLKLVDHTSN